MKTTCAIFAFVALVGCARDEGPSGDRGVGGGAGESTATFSSSGLPTDRSCDGKTEGELCGGSIDDPIHGECDADGTCEWTEWTCIHGSPGDKCQGGICSAPWPSFTENSCCSAGCINADGHCINIPGTWGGEECP